ncbi:MAG: hypothetical protein ACLFWL_13055 [Candidatus Brocadiia bacterium]
MKLSRDRKRRGTVLVIVVGLLAVLMLLAGTLAIISRVELRTSSYLQAEQNIDEFVSAIEAYCVDILQTDKFGSDANKFQYDFEKLDAESGGTVTNPVYPCGYTYAALAGDNESFDSPHEEWLPGAETYRMFQASTNDAAIKDTNNDGVVNDNDAKWAIWKNALNTLGSDWGGSTDQMGEFALYWVDVGGRCLDVNIAGDGQAQGLSAHEADLASTLESLGVSATDAADCVTALRESRYGSDTDPGVSGDSDNDRLGNDHMDFDASGVIDGDDTDPVDEPTEFDPEYPAFNSSTGNLYDRPFGTTDLQDMLWGVVGSRATSMLHDDGGLSGDSLQYFTTRSGGTILAARSIRGSNAFANTLTTASNLGGYEFMQYGTMLTNSLGGDMNLCRALQNGLPNLDTADNSTKVWLAENLRDFLFDLEAVVLPGASPTDDQKRVILTQVAFNLIDMLDDDSEPTNATGLTVGGGNYDFAGVEVTPYIAEVEAGIDSSVHPFRPANDGTISDPGSAPGRAAKFLYNDANGNTNFDPGEEIWIDDGSVDGQYDNDDTRFYDGGDGSWDTLETMPGTEIFYPPTGWGKYIKLVNPWNKPINLSDYSIEITGLRTWKFEDWTGDGEPDGWHSTSAPTRNITLPDKTIPAGGHFLIVDNALSGGPFANVIGDVGNMQVPEINCMQEFTGGPTKETSPPVKDDYATSDGSPTVLTLKRSGQTVMRFVVQDNAGEDDGDGVTTATTSTQIGDPRPSWWRWRDPDGDGVGTLAFVGTNGAWAMGGAVNILNRTYDGTPGWHSDSIKDTTQLAWFNRSWQGTGQVPSGDRWNQLGSGDDNVLHSFPPADVGGAEYSAAGEIMVMDIGKLPSPGYLGFVPSGVEWGTLSLTENPPVTGVDVVYPKNFFDYVVGPTSPFENGADEDRDGAADDDGSGDGDSGGPEIRLCGKINVNMAPAQVITALFEQQRLQALWADAAARRSALVAAIEDERNTNGPFSSVDDFFNRVPKIFEVGDGGSPENPDSSVPNSARREALARFMYNLVTVRTDVWAILGRARVGRDTSGDGDLEESEVDVDKQFFIILDRSYDPPKVLVRRYKD